MSLAALRDPDLVLPTIVQTLGAKEPRALEQHLREQQLLLVLDNNPPEVVLAQRSLDDLAPLERIELLEEQHWRRREGARRCGCAERTLAPLPRRPRSSPRGESVLALWLPESGLGLHRPVSDRGPVLFRRR